MSLPFAPPKATSGKIILIATAEAKAGKGDEVVALLAKVRAAAESADEAGTLTYRTVRSEENKDHFLVFEEYNLPDGIVDHVKGATFQALASADLLVKLDVNYYNEFK